LYITVSMLSMKTEMDGYLGPEGWNLVGRTAKPGAEPSGWHGMLR
jgi:hypothetical protein